jgi:hypothetical protein
MSSKDNAAPKKGKQRIKKSAKRKQPEEQESHWQPLALVPPEEEDPPPLSTFSGTLKQIETAAIPEPAHEVFTYFFPRFESLNRMPGGLSDGGRIVAFDNHLHAHYIGVRQRRFAGDDTLPRGSYWAVESVADPEYHFSDFGFDAENNPVIRELFSYAEPFRRINPKLIDSTIDTDEVDQLRTLGLTEAGNPCIIQIIEPHDEGALPAALGINPDEVTILEYPLRISTVTIPDVLDLRMPSAALWLVKFCASREASVVEALEVEKPESPTVFFTRLLRFLLHQEGGGSLPLLQGIGAWLRSNGVAGLVFPSARCDSGVIVKNGEVTSWWGFNYVDYRGSSPVAGQGHFGWTPGVPNMDEVQFAFALDPKLAGTWFVGGVAELQVLRYAAMQEEFDEKQDEVRERLRDGSIYVSDPLVALFWQSGTWHMHDFPTVGHFIAYRISGIEVLGEPTEFAYDGQSWFLSRDTPGSNDQLLLLCPRCARVLIFDDAGPPEVPASCPTCGLGDRAAHARWEPDESWPGTPFLS